MYKHGGRLPPPRLYKTRYPNCNVINVRHHCGPQWCCTPRNMNTLHRKRIMIFGACWDDLVNASMYWSTCQVAGCSLRACVLAQCVHDFHKKCCFILLRSYSRHCAAESRPARNIHYGIPHLEDCEAQPFSWTCWVIGVTTHRIHWRGFQMDLEIVKYILINCASSMAFQMCVCMCVLWRLPVDADKYERVAVWCLNWMCQHCQLELQCFPGLQHMLLWSGTGWGILALASWFAVRVERLDLFWANDQSMENTFCAMSAVLVLTHASACVLTFLLVLVIVAVRVSVYGCLRGFVACLYMFVFY